MAFGSGLESVYGTARRMRGMALRYWQGSALGSFDTTQLYMLAWLSAWFWHSPLPGSARYFLIGCGCIEWDFGIR